MHCPPGCRKDTLSRLVEVGVEAACLWAEDGAPGLMGGGLQGLQPCPRDGVRLQWNRCP